MAFTVFNTTDTLEQVRVKLNNLTQVDFGNPALLTTVGLVSTNIVGAVIEIANVAFSAAGWVIRDSTSSIQNIGAGQTLNVFGTSNQITAVVTPADTLTIGLPNNVTIPNDLIVTNTLSAGNTTLTGNLTSNGTITSSTAAISFSNKNLLTTGTLSSGATSVTSLVSTGAVSGTTITGTGAITGSELNLTTNGTILFEGSINDAFKTTLTVVNPTASRTITLPNVDGTVITTGDTGSIATTMIADSAITSAKIADGTIVNADIADNTITFAKLNSTSLSSAALIVNSLTATTISGTSSATDTVNLTATNTTNATHFITFTSAATGGQVLRTDTSLTYNPSTNVLTTTASQANYADLAEIFETDKKYAIGTVVMVGGDKEVTECFLGHRALGVISERPAFLMNAKANGQPVALKGRVKVKVVGEIKKGDELIAANGGFATNASGEFSTKENNEYKKVFAIALENNEKGLIEAIIL